MDTGGHCCPLEWIYKYGNNVNYDNDKRILATLPNISGVEIGPVLHGRLISECILKKLNLECFSIDTLL